MSVREQLAKEWLVDLDAFKAANDDILSSYFENAKAARESGEEAIVFDRNAMFMLRNSNAFEPMAPSPLRKGNFDLLILMATQESIHRILRDLMDAGSDREVSFEWFRDYYVERAAKFFDGDRGHGNADDFLEELLLTAPVVRNKDRKMELIDPFRIAEDIIKYRGDVAMEWKVAVSKVTEEHMDLRKELFSKQMSKWGQPAAGQDSPTQDSVEAVGEFQ